MAHWSDKLLDFPEIPCEEGLAWAKTQPDFKTAWANCEHADWMFWLLAVKSECPNWPMHDQYMATIRAFRAYFRSPAGKATLPQEIREHFTIPEEL
jgi:hypothetical protein